MRLVCVCVCVCVCVHWNRIVAEWGRQDNASHARWHASGEAEVVGGRTEEIGFRDEARSPILVQGKLYSFFHVHGDR